MFGVTPCPVTIFTFGLLLVGGSAAVLLQVPQDWLLLVSGCVALPLILFRGRQKAQSVRIA
jgi:hypothetical protein